MLAHLNQSVRIHFNWIITHMNGFVKFKHNINLKKLCEPLSNEGGKPLIDRLTHLFELRSRLELGDLLGITPGTISTWTTRKTTPYELLARIHLLTGVSMEYLCFGTGSRSSEVLESGEISTKLFDNAVKKMNNNTAVMLDTFSIRKGSFDKIHSSNVDIALPELVGLTLTEKDFAVEFNAKLFFIDTADTTPNQGAYLFSINGNYQIGELRLLPDGQVYLMLDGDKFPINNDTTKIHGKVVSVLERK